MAEAAAEGSMRLTYDATTDVAYLSLRLLRAGELLGPTLLVEPDHDFPGAVALDFSAEDGRVVGFELQLASACVPPELLATAERTDGCSVAARFDERVARRLAAALRLPGDDARNPGRAH
jgi:uncharacterized protein YuzE